MHHLLDRGVRSLALGVVGPAYNLEEAHRDSFLVAVHSRDAEEDIQDERAFGQGGPPCREGRAGRGTYLSYRSWIFVKLVRRIDLGSGREGGKDGHTGGPLGAVLTLLRPYGGPCPRLDSDAQGAANVCEVLVAFL